ncbi:hypothetical protein [Lentzea albida]|uniref:DUF4365 domain-containing protein n=1 Tax=Lentzea albida TaxID=65499 RepID=A0A1H9QUR2_9PSEU|nr:hypothetical protein [Lentzea albida]SER63589.1 hypothetical protein SAMN04488000_110242 [Lentzea albida]
MGLPDSELEAPSPAGRMGKAAEYLVAATCILASRGRLNVATQLIDDEGIDLLFSSADAVTSLAVQVKARMSTSKRVKSETFMAFVRTQTFRPRPSLDMLFVAIDVDRGAIIAAWLVPSTVFAEEATESVTQGRYRFYASLKEGGRDRWQTYRLAPEELAPRLLARLRELDDRTI